MQATEALDGEDGRPVEGSSAHDDVLLEALLSHVSRSILISTMEQAKSVGEISRDSKIPLSTCYEKVAELLARGVLKRERIVITERGKRYALYRAAIRTIYAEFGPRGLEVATMANVNGFDKSRSMTELFGVTRGSKNKGGERT